MQSVLSPVIIASLLPLILLLVNLFTGLVKSEDYSKNSSFSCGFDSFSSPRLHFKMLYYKVVLIFVVFDLEISLISPLIYVSHTNWSGVVLTLVLFLLLVGLSFEVYIGSLNWTY